MEDRTGTFVNPEGVTMERVGASYVPEYIFAPKGYLSSQQNLAHHLRGDCKCHSSPFLRDIEHFRVWVLSPCTCSPEKIGTSEMLKHQKGCDLLDEPHVVDVGAAITQTDKIYFDTSSCSPKDTYNHKVGFAISLRRAIYNSIHRKPTGISPKEWKGRRWRWYGMAFIEEKGLNGTRLRDYVRDTIMVKTGLFMEQRGKVQSYPSTYSIKMREKVRKKVEEQD